jgi:alpha-galactosidase/6-phospho-beta-glucosidase family protein
LKKFDFPLGRVMNWRQTMAQVEESKLQNLYAELRSIEASEAELVAERESSQKSVTLAASVTGSELAMLDTFRRYAVAEHTRLEQRRADCVKRIGTQVKEVAQKRRDVKLLEQLRSSRLTTWRRELEREIDSHAEEAYLARWSRQG